MNKKKNTFRKTKLPLKVTLQTSECRHTALCRTLCLRLNLNEAKTEQEVDSDQQPNWSPLCLLF